MGAWWGVGGFRQAGWFAPSFDCPLPPGHRRCANCPATCPATCPANCPATCPAPCQLPPARNEAYWLAFTVPEVDRLFGTAPQPAGVRMSDMARAALKSSRGSGPSASGGGSS